VAAAITKGELEIRDCNPEHCNRVIAKLRDVGVEIEEINQSTLHVRCDKRGLRAGDLITEPYPGFPTDMQAQYMTLMTQANGRSIITETIFENRFMHGSELQRMGARIQISHDQAVVDGPSQLIGARVQASDLRASASLVLAGLVAEGETLIDRVYHIDRGYEKIETKLKEVGADIERLRESVTSPLSSQDEEAAA
jgi:UDP-N-acetylglucosamine 1-carboxyvinyltransferase